jgi:uncharacterized cupin superfamily protein
MTKYTKVIDFQQDSGERETIRLRDLPDRVLQGDPHHESIVLFADAAGGVVAGKWTSTPGKWRTFTERDEFCHIVSGHVRVLGDDGTIRSFKAGDAFLIPNGFSGCWEVIETTTKHFVVRHHKAN